MIDELIAQAGLAAFAEATKLTGNDAVRRRVEKASVCAYRAAIEPCWNLKSAADFDPALKQRMRPLVRQFFILCQQHGVSRVSEGQAVAEARQRLRELFGLREAEKF